MDSSDCWYCTPWFAVCLVLFELKYGLLRTVLDTLFHTIERYTSPVISVPDPKLQFDASPASAPLVPSAAGAGKIQCYDKGRNVPLGIVRAMNADDVKTVVQKARVAQVQWAKTSWPTRRKLLFSLMDYILKKQKTICETSAIECGKTMVDGSFGEILTTLEKLRWTAANGEEVLQEEVRDVGLITMHKRAAVNYVPFGVIGAIVSWNYPFHNIFGPMISALFAGNAFVGKVSEFSSFYAEYYQSIVRNALEQLGQSPDLVTFVTGFAEAGETLVATADKVTFIGSPQVGKLVMRKASETLTPVVLELGGKDPAIICDDADLDQLLPIILRGTFQNCGQNCVGLERIVVHEKLHDRLLSAVLSKVSTMTQGATTNTEGKVNDLGAMTMGAASVQKIQKLVDESVASGAKLLAGGKATSPNFFPPTILTNVTPTTPIAVEEVFGPVLVVMKFRTDDEAVQMVNACPYGLGSSVFSCNTNRAKAIADRLNTGMVNINDFGINYLCQSLPFGGVKISGFDRFAGREGLRGNCIVRASTSDRIPGVKTVVPPILQYPIQKTSFAFTELLSNVLYGKIPSFFAAAAKLALFKQPATNSTEKKKN
jgi:acyl-CoA reductase-like NAD-dependent aldehyde dehydrogenase